MEYSDDDFYPSDSESDDTPDSSTVSAGVHVDGMPPNAVWDLVAGMTAIDASAFLLTYPVLQQLVAKMPCEQHARTATDSDRFRMAACLMSEKR